MDKEFEYLLARVFATAQAQEDVLAYLRSHPGEHLRDEALATLVAREADAVQAGRATGVKGEMHPDDRRTYCHEWKRLYLVLDQPGEGPGEQNDPASKPRQLDYCQGCRIETEQEVDGSILRCLTCGRLNWGDDTLPSSIGPLGEVLLVARSRYYLERRAYYQQLPAGGEQRESGEIHPVVGFLPGDRWPGRHQGGRRSGRSRPAGERGPGDKAPGGQEKAQDQEGPC